MSNSHIVEKVIVTGFCNIHNLDDGDVFIINNDDSVLYRIVDNKSGIEYLDNAKYKTHSNSIYVDKSTKILENLLRDDTVVTKIDHITDYSVGQYIVFNYKNESIVVAPIISVTSDSYVVMHMGLSISVKKSNVIYEETEVLNDILSSLVEYPDAVSEVN